MNDKQERAIREYGPNWDEDLARRCVQEGVGNDGAILVAYVAATEGPAAAHALLDRCVQSSDQPYI